MTKWKKIAICGSAVALMMGTLFTASYAWFRTNNNADLGSGQGATASAYFAGGDGSAEHPYIINAPIHLYNLAWLQYLDYFNQVDSSNVYQQKYFVLGADVNMASDNTNNWTLPPIGTITNPFIGNFDGGNYTISNLTVDNAIGDGHITRKPTTVGSTLSGVNIVGTFGVVGPYGSVPTGYTYSSITNTVKNVYINKAEIHSQTSLTLVGIAAGYVNSVISGVGVSESKIVVPSSAHALSSSLTSNISDYTSVGYCTDNYTTQTDGSKTYYKGNHYVNETTISTPTVSNYLVSYQGSGTAVGAGGSIAMSDMYTRLTSFRSDDAATNLDLGNKTVTKNYTGDATTPNSTTVTSTYGSGYFKTYYDETGTGVEAKNYNRLKGSYCFGYYSGSSSATPNTNIVYLYGYENITQTVTNVRTYTNIVNTPAYYISNGSNYLTANGTSGVKNATSAANATKWIFSATSGSTTISTIIDSTTYYLTGDENDTFSLGTSSFTWTLNNSKLSYSYSWYGTTYTDYIYQSGKTWSLNYQGSSTTLTLTATTVSVTRTTTNTTTTTENNGVHTPDSYFPINIMGSLDAEHPYIPSNTNTGYVVSGASYHSTDGDWPYRSGDVRVSKYAKVSSLATALNNASSYTDARLQVVTHTTPTTAEPNGKFVRVLDKYNAATTSVSGSYSTAGISDAVWYGKAGSTYNNTTYSSGLDLTKYEKSRTQLSSTLSSATDSYVYGLHFMNANINDFTSVGTADHNLLTAPVAKVKRAKKAIKTYTNYQMPRDSIDFNLEDRGFVNFFAGTYFSGNTSFFSLHKIERDANDQISSIQRITKIYGTSSAADDYIYQYTDSSNNVTYSGTLTASYHLVFDTAWIESPTMVTNAMYYFEVPVNSGEYALGCSSSGTGAYLIYLDISANAQEIDRTAVLEKITTVTKSYAYPMGVAIVTTPSMTKETVNALASAAVAMKDTYSGSTTRTLTLTKTTDISGSTINFNSSDSEVVGVFKGDSIKLTQSGSVDPPVEIPLSSIQDVVSLRKTQTTRRLTYYDYNIVTKTNSITIFSITNDGSADGTETWSRTDTDSSGNVTTPTTFVKDNGEEVALSTANAPAITTISTAGILTYSYGFDSASSTITVNFTLTTADSGNTSYSDKKVAGYTITMASTTDDLQVTVSVWNNTYVITFTANGSTTTVTAVGNTITVTHG